MVRFDSHHHIALEKSTQTNPIKLFRIHQPNILAFIVTLIKIYVHPTKPTHKTNKQTNQQKIYQTLTHSLSSTMFSHFLSHFFFFFFFFVISLLSFPHTVVHSQCNKTPPVIFNFGDSNSDTGGLVAGLGFPVNSPNGRTFFRRSTGRVSDGRLLIDLLCKWDPPIPKFLLILLFLIRCI